MQSALRDSAETIQAMKNEHSQYEIESALSGNDSRIPLTHLVKSNIKKPAESSGFGISVPEEKEEKEETELSIFFKKPQVVNNI